MPDPQDSPYDFAEPDPPRPGQPKPAGPPKPPPSRLTTNRPAPPARPAVKSAPAPAAPDKSDDATRFCPYCGFTFQGKPKARCPECAAPMDSPADLLQFADPRWVRTTALGFLLLALAIGAHVAGCLFRWFGTEEAKGLSHIVAAILLVVAIFLATRKETNPVAQAATPSAIPLWARLSAIASMILWFVLGLVALGAVDLGRVNKPLLMLLLPIQGALCIMLAVFCSRLATRIPSDSLSTHATYTGWLSAIVNATVFVIVALEMTKGAYPMFFMCSFPLAAGLLAIMAWTMITLLRLFLDMRASATAGDAITARRAQRQAK